MSEKTVSKNLEFYGGTPVLLVPFSVMFIGILWLGLNGTALPEAFWPMVLLGLFVGLLLAKNKKDFVDALIQGISSNMLAIMLLAWFLAGVMAKLLSTTGLIEGLVWGFLGLGVTAAWFPLITFLASALMSVSTGTAVGTLIGASPILFPVGYSLGADPLLLVGAIIGGSFVGDNLAPISDTTIVSAYSQGTKVDRVVKTRIKYVVVAGIFTVALYIGFALFFNRGLGIANTPEDLKAAGLLMLVVPVLLMYMMIKGQHLVTALLYSIFAGLVVALLAGLIRLSDILLVNKEQFSASGIVIDGINGMLGVAVFTVFLMGMIGTLQKGDFIEWLMVKSEKFATTPRRAEITIVFTSLVVNALTTAGTPSMVMLGPFVRRLGHKFKISPERRGNLLDACSTTIIGFLPYSVAVLIPFAFVGGMVENAAGINFSPVGVVPYVFYCWALMLVIIYAAFTGWGSDTITDEQYFRESEEIYGNNLKEEIAVSNE
ncbi:Na+/H+ antiporter NhaC family protein [Pseudalkalibacillus sp. A8]|uniref:Na+/H+ antiporter NhaC family protein n=1 Tax=Pseudalkalibacillus sp. A8 TaxID=3382641 RepID=UPI0038B47AC1